MSKMDFNSPTQVSTPSLLSSPMPLQFSGFRTGDTIQVQGETGNLQFSFRLDINQKTSPENPASRHNSPSSYSSYATPIASRELEDNNDNSGESGARTRLRSGAISPVAYFPQIPLRKSESWTRERARSKKNVLERLLRRRSCPVRPCTSYAFFVMANWGVLNKSSSSFGETSKRVAQLWFKLPTNDKKLYEEMALKDNARYKWQAELFLNNLQCRF